MRRGLMLSAAKQALVFIVFIALAWSFRAVRVAAILKECPLPPMRHLPFHVRQHSRPLGPGFGNPAAADIPAPRAAASRWVGPTPFCDALGHRTVISSSRWVCGRSQVCCVSPLSPAA